jgi:hypothetical protein
MYHHVIVIMLMPQGAASYPHVLTRCYRHTINASSQMVGADLGMIQSPLPTVVTGTGCTGGLCAGILLIPCNRLMMLS